MIVWRPNGIRLLYWFSMNGGFLAGLKRFVWWDYARSTWQYEVMVSLILAFIFLTPRELFNDQPRPKNVTLLHTSADGSSFLIEPDQLAASDDAGRRLEAEKLIQSQAGGKNRKLDRVEAISPDGREIRFFVAYTRP